MRIYRIESSQMICMKKVKLMYACINKGLDSQVKQKISIFLEKKSTQHKKSKR